MPDKVVSGLFTGSGVGGVGNGAAGRGAVEGTGAGTGSGAGSGKSPAGAPGRGGNGAPPGGMGSGAGGRLEGANRVLVAGRLCPWIFYHVADPMYAPHPKGWETTLEPYRSLELLIYDS